MEIVETRLLIVEISAVAQGVQSGKSIVRSELRRAPNIIGIGCNKIAASVVDADDITLQVYIIIVQCAVTQETVSRARLIIQEKQRFLSLFQTEQLAVDVVIVRCYPVYRLADTVAVPVVGIGIGIRTVGYGRQFAPRRPGERLSVVIGQRVADRIIGDRSAVERGQKIAPTGICVSIGVIGLAVLGGSQNIPF